MKVLFLLAIGIHLSTATVSYLGSYNQGITAALIGECDVSDGISSNLYALLNKSIDYTADGFDTIISPGDLLHTANSTDVTIEISSILATAITVTGTTEKTMTSVNTIVIHGAGDDDFSSGRVDGMSGSHGNNRWYHPGTNYSVTLLSGTNQAIRVIVIDTTVFVHACRGGCQETTVCAATTVNNTVAAHDYCDATVSNVTVERLAWLRDEIKSATEDYVIVVGSHPIVSVAANEGNTTNKSAILGYPDLRALVNPVLESTKPTMYLYAGDTITQVLESSAGVMHVGVGSCGTAGTIWMNQADLNHHHGTNKFKLKYNTTAMSMATLKADRTSASLTVTDNTGKILHHEDVKNSNSINVVSSDDNTLVGIWVGAAIALLACVVLVGWMYHRNRRGGSML